MNLPELPHLGQVVRRGSGSSARSWARRHYFRYFLAGQYNRPPLHENPRGEGCISLPASGMAEPQEGADMTAKTPQDVDRLFEERINAGDLEGVLTLYEPGATLVLPEGDITGVAAFRDATQEMLAARLRLQTKVTKVVRVGD